LISSSPKLNTETEAKRPEEENRNSLQEQLLPIYFNFDSYQINEESLKRLKQYALWLKEASLKKILIEGHVQEDRPQSNIPLSQRQAESVADFLMSQGIPKERIETRGYGATRPAKQHPSPYNGRAQIKLVWH
jgi:outer membrane protein OmpA-like peptidoglycan-associated protein